jgi:Domain of unknown function (DUF1929)/Bacterial Ig domain/Glyoxal oxidase N-terminus
VQGNYVTPQTPQTTVTVSYPAMQNGGNLNVIIVGWSNTSATISSVTDTQGNLYQPVAPPLILNGALSQRIYYAVNILAAGTTNNSVKVTFTSPAASPDIRVLEYNGIDATNPIDVAVGATGSGASSSIAPVATSNSADLLVAANTVQGLTSGPDPNFTQRILTSPDGNIVEDRVVTTAGSYSCSDPLNPKGGWVMQMVAFRAALLPPDTTPPTVTITSPAAGAPLTGTVNVVVGASDPSGGTGVAAVQFVVDGVPLGTAANTAPYTFSLNTAKFGNGTHSLTASAWDFAQNVGNASPIPVTFSNSSPGSPAQTGIWSGTVPLPIVSVHSALLPGGRILMSDGEIFGATAIVWDPVTNTTDPVTAPTNIFCGAMEQMADGRILVVGGHQQDHIGLPSANVFDPSNESWSRLPDMAFSRWYPTVTMLSDGRFIVLSGESNCSGCDVTVPEIYDPSTNSWSQLTSATLAFPYYPHAYLLQNSKLLVVGCTQEPIASQLLDLNALTWIPVGGAAVDGGSSAMYLPGKILKMGTAVAPEEGGQHSVGTAYVLDTTQPLPVWRQVASMAFVRSYHSTTLLPDGNVLVTGGGTTTTSGDVANAVLPAEMWSADTELWTTLASMNAPRLYHSEALLLPDGRVLVMGGGRFANDTEPTDQFSAEFFAPPYLFRGPRPVILSAPSKLLYGQNFTVQTPDAGRIAKVVLVRFGTDTHDINMSQRFLPLSFASGASSLSVTAPVDANLAPPGNYMLFLVDTLGIPSMASFAHF